MIAVFAYHSVADTAYLYAVSPEMFRAQLRLLARRGFVFVRTSELPALLAEGHAGRRIACITFDDGYEDNYRNAFPILKEERVPATIFMATGCAGNPEAWRALGFSGRPLTWEQAREMRASGLIEIENHTRSHRVLTRLADEELAAELSGARADIETHLGHAPTVIAYPKGRFNAQVRAAAQRYAVAAMGGAGLIEAGKVVNRFAIPRILVYRADPLWKFAARLSPLFWYLSAARARLRRRA